MAAKDKASNRYLAGLTAVTAVYICMLHGLMQNPNLLKSQELIMDGADLTPFVDLAASAANSFVMTVGTAIVAVAGILLSGAVMLVLRYFFRDTFLAGTARRDLRFAVIAGVLCLAAGLLFSRLQMIGVSLILCLPVPVVSWSVFHAGRAPEDPEQAERKIGEDQYY